MFTYWTKATINVFDYPQSNFIHDRFHDQKNSKRMCIDPWLGTHCFKFTPGLPHLIIFLTHFRYSNANVHKSIAQMYIFSRLTGKMSNGSCSEIYNLNGFKMVVMSIQSSRHCACVRFHFFEQVRIACTF